jgi:hypothetical protein
LDHRPFGPQPNVPVSRHVRDRSVVEVLTCPRSCALCRTKCAPIVPLANDLQGATATTRPLPGSKNPRVSGGFCQSGRLDLDHRPFGPQPNALPDCAPARGVRAHEHRGRNAGRSSALELAQGGPAGSASRLAHLPSWLSRCARRSTTACQCSVSREGGALRKPVSFLLVVRHGTLESVDLVALSHRNSTSGEGGADAPEPSPCCIAEDGVGTSDS